MTNNRFEYLAWIERSDDSRNYYHANFVFLIASFYLSKQPYDKWMKIEPN